MYLCACNTKDHKQPKEPWEIGTKEKSYAVGGNVNWCSHCFKNRHTDKWNRELRNKLTHI